jgi:hypothetical protein
MTPAELKRLPKALGLKTSQVHFLTIWRGFEDDVVADTRYSGWAFRGQALAYELEKQWIFDPKTFQPRARYERLFRELRTNGVPDHWNVATLEPSMVRAYGAQTLPAPVTERG